MVDDDGLDSNGNATISGGTVVVNGPTNDAYGALDVNGELAVSGGTVAATGSADMALTPSASSTQSGAQVTFGRQCPGSRRPPLNAPERPALGTLAAEVQASIRTPRQKATRSLMRAASDFGLA